LTKLFETFKYSDYLSKEYHDYRSAVKLKLFGEGKLKDYINNQIKDIEDGFPLVPEQSNEWKCKCGTGNIPVDCDKCPNCQEKRAGWTCELCTT
jgi:hypothetical protein